MIIKKSIWGLNTIDLNQKHFYYYCESYMFSKLCCLTVIDWANMPLCHVASLCALMNCFHNSLWPSDIVSWHRFGSTLAQVMACCLTAPSHFLNQYCLIISHIFSHSPERNFTRNTQDINPWCEFDIYWFKFTAISTRGQWVKSCLRLTWKIVCTTTDKYGYRVYTIQ